MKGTPESARIDGEARSILETAMTSPGMKWAEFQSALDAYRDAAYWKGYETAKKEWIRDIISKQMEKGE